MPMNVVAAIIRNTDNHILITRRKPEKSLAGFWEFPGGKVDLDESNERALVREIKEELNLLVQVDGYIMTSVYAYEFGTIHLHGYDCHIEGTIPQVIDSADHDLVLWVGVDELADYKFAPADVPIIENLVNDYGTPLMGGNMNTPILKDNHVYKEKTIATPTIHKVLNHVRSKGIDWVPKSQVDLTLGKHILSYLDGDVPHDMPEWIWNEDILLDIARKMRELHDATLDFSCEGAKWNNDSGEPYEVICHNDFAPYNCVFEDEAFVGLIDFDVCSPGTRLWDLAYAAYRFVPLCPTDQIEIYMECSPFSKEVMLNRLKAFIRAYAGDRIELTYDIKVVIDKVQQRLRALALWSEAYARENHRDDILGHAKMYALHADWLDCLISTVMEVLIIKQCTTDDLEEIKKISESTFLETFADTNTDEDMANYIQENFNEAQLRVEINHANSFFYLVDVDGAIAGYMKLNMASAQTEDGHPNGLEVQRLYILEKFKGMGIGKKLMKEAVEFGKNQGLEYLWLGVWEHNLAAIRFYEKQGFEKFSQHIFMVGDDPQVDYLMKRTI